MAITPIQNFISSVQSGTQAATSAQTSKNTVPATQTQTTSSAVVSNASLEVTASLQNNSVGLAQLSSLLEEAQSGTQQIGSILQQVQSLAGEAEQGGPPSALASLDSEFQELLAQINQVAAGTTFGGTSLLNGSLSSGSGGTENLSVPDLSTQGLFGNTTPNLLNVGNAAQASAAIAAAQNVVNTASGDIGATQAEVSFTSAGVETALANNDAATSTLSENDLNSSPSDFLNALLGNPATTASAQTGNLPASLIGLLQE